MAMIEIPDGPGIHLADLLERISIVDRMDWAILEMWAVGRDDELDVVELERLASGSTTGLSMTGPELRAFAGKLAQFVDGIVVGHRGRPPARSDADLRIAADIVIEAIDSTLWRVYARDQAVIQRLRADFSDATDVVPEVAVLAEHERS